MNKKLRVGVVGVGNMGANHARSYSKIENVEFKAVSDINIESAKKVAEENGVDYFFDFAEMIKIMKLDAVSVCVPTSLHVPVSRACLDLGTHVLLEKPIALSVEDGEELLKYAKTKERKLFVGHIERFNPAVKKVKEIIDKGELGKITAIMARRVGGFPPQIKDADIAVDLAIHDVDIVNFLLGELPIKIESHLQKNHIENRSDAAEFFLKYSSASAYIQTNWITPVKIRKLNITGSEGYLEMDYISQDITFYKSNYDKFREDIGDYSDYILRFSDPDTITISVSKREPLMEEIKFFIDGVSSGTPLDSRFAVEALRIVKHGVSNAQTNISKEVSREKQQNVFMHESACVSDKATLGLGTKVWHGAQVREKATIGKNCVISKNAYVGRSVSVGDNCKIQNNASVYQGTAFERGVFVGPHVIFTNDRIPRAINVDGSQKSVTDWQVTPTFVDEGASIGAGSVILPGIKIGRYAMVGAGSVVTHDVPDFCLVVGNPARVVGKVDMIGNIIERYARTEK